MESPFFIDETGASKRKSEGFRDVDFLLSGSAMEFPDADDFVGKDDIRGRDFTGKAESLLDVQKQLWGEQKGPSHQPFASAADLPQLFARDESDKRACEWAAPELPSSDTVQIESITLASGDDFKAHYFRGFLNKPHALYYGTGSTLKAFIVALRPKVHKASGQRASLCPQQFLASLDQPGTVPKSPRTRGGTLVTPGLIAASNYYFVLIFSPLGTHRYIIDTTSKSSLTSLLSAKPREFPTASSVKSELLNLFPDLQIHTLGRVRGTPHFEIFSRRLVQYEERIRANGHKFGLLYCKPGQRDESEYFRNTCEAASPAYQSFLAWLGRTIELEGYEGYAGGLDVRKNTTGRTTIAAQLTVPTDPSSRKTDFEREREKLELIFHVPTMMPFVEVDPQAVERKRHVGNDIVCLVFQDQGAEPFVPTCVLTTFIHVFIVVRDLGNDSYHVGVVCKDKMPPFGPPLPSGEIFHKDQIFRKWLLHKLVNAERAALYHPRFWKPLTQSRQLLLQDLISYVAPTLFKKAK